MTGRESMDMIQSYNGRSPDIADSAYVHESAVVIGKVVIEEQASIWPNTTLRGDNGELVVSARANVQDNAVLHEDAVLEADVTVGHNAIVHGATVARGALIGMNSIVLDGANIGEESIVAAGAVVTKGTDVPPQTLVTGTPASPKTKIDEPTTLSTAEHYVDLSRQYLDEQRSQ